MFLGILKSKKINKKIKTSINTPTSSTHGRPSKHQLHESGSLWSVKLSVQVKLVISCLFLLQEPGRLYTPTYIQHRVEELRLNNEGVFVIRLKNRIRSDKSTNFVISKTVFLITKSL